MLTTIILIYSILICSYYYVKFKNESKLIVYNNGQLLVQIAIVSLFLISYVLFLRFLNLFRSIKILDLHNININFNLILFFILLYVFRKLIIYIFKLSWFKVHYVMMCETNFSLRVHKNYKYFFYANYITTIILIFFLYYDLFFNNLILNYSLWYLKYYSFFKVFYICYKFMIIKQSLVLDYYNYNLMYPGNYEKKNFLFINCIDDNHFFLITESKKYSLGVILERENYVPRYLGDISSLPYFKKY